MNSNSRVFICLTFVLIALLSVAAPVSARSNGELEKNFEVLRSAPKANTTVTRADTMFCFAASGAGAYGTAGTNARGFSFDDGMGGPSTAGWTTIDHTAQDGNWWHIESTTVCAGHATDMVDATPFGGGDNLYALWCGRLNVCGWVIPNGYGNSWEQYIVFDCGSWDTSAQVEFLFRSDYEADSCDWLEVMVELDGEWTTVIDYQNQGPTDLLTGDVTVLAADYVGQEIGDIGLRFTSDSGWSSQDGSWPNDMGPVWVDNIILTVDGTEVGRSDFEDNIQPAWMDFTSPAGAGIYGELYSNLFSEDICVVNPTYAWAFYDPETTAGTYPIPLVIYGPPYCNNGIQSPVLNLAHELGNPVGEPIVMTATSAVYLDYWCYMDNPLNALIFQMWGISAETEEVPCLGLFADDNTVYYGPDKVWIDTSRNVTLALANSANEGTVTGIAAQLSVIDQCGVWCNVHGDGTGHTPAPYFDNAVVKIVDDSAVAWNVDQFRRFQDNFPETNGYVRIDNSDDIAPNDDPSIMIGDSTVVELNMDLIGGIQTHTNTAAGEVRPNFYMYYRVTEGPNAGTTSPMTADQDDTDGLYCPYMGTQDWFGETWNYCVADSANRSGVVNAGVFAFDLNDEFFLPGDVIEHFYWAEAIDGTIETAPGWALSSNPDLRSAYVIRCLPTAGTTLLFVNDDGGVGAWWYEAFLYNGYGVYDEYDVQAPTSGLENGLAGRAIYDDIADYRTIVWDSGDIPSYTITSSTLGDKSDDANLLSEWLNQHEHDAFLWIMGSEVASDLTNAVGFLNVDMGVQAVSTTLFYDDYSEILVPKVFASHAYLQWLGGSPEIWIDGGCPSIENFSAIQATGTLSQVAFEWEYPTDSELVAGVYNLDPDANGTNQSPQGYNNRVLYNPFSYYQVWDAGYGLSANEDYSRLMVGHVLTNMLGTLPTEAPVGVEDPAPAVTRMHGSFPNPFNPKTTISFALGNNEHVNLSVYDITGRLVRTLVNETMDSGDHEVVWNGKDSDGHQVASGVYFYKMTAGDFTSTDKMTMLK